MTCWNGRDSFKNVNLCRSNQTNILGEVFIMKNLSFRQVHLDFHTSEKIEHVGDNFDPDEFVVTLKNACVNSITCIAYFTLYSRKAV